MMVNNSKDAGGSTPGGTRKGDDSHKVTVRPKKKSASSSSSMFTASWLTTYLCILLAAYVFIFMFTANQSQKGKIELLETELGRAYGELDQAKAKIQEQLLFGDSLDEQVKTFRLINEQQQKRMAALQTELASNVKKCDNSNPGNDPHQTWGQQQLTDGELLRETKELKAELERKKNLFLELETRESYGKEELRAVTSKLVECQQRSGQPVQKQHKAPEPATRAPVPVQHSEDIALKHPVTAPSELYNEETKQRQAAIRGAMKHSWNGYEKFAFGFDELRPMSMRGHNWLALGGTIVDSLDTLLIMDMKEEFNKARDWVVNELNFDKDLSVSFFETTIRVLGGLLSAYEMSGDKGLLAKAKDIGDRLMFAFNTPTGLPLTSVNLRTHAISVPSWTAGATVLAEVGSVQLEFAALARHTGDNSYVEKSFKVMELLDNMDKSNGLYPLYMDPKNLRFTSSQISIGAMGDSFYEYLLKMHLMSNKTRPEYKRMYEESVLGILNTLLQHSSPSELLYLAEMKNGQVVHKMDHLTCFAAGMMALGSRGKSKNSVEMRVAEGLVKTCYEMYMRMPCGLSPETVMFRDGQDFVAGARYNIERPETLESIFIMWRLTHNPMYREWGWNIFQNFEKHTKVDSGGYSGLRDVTQPNPPKDDTMQTFWLAETLKYLYLLFSPDDLISLDEYVFNTEAHPLRIFDFNAIFPPSTHSKK